MVKFKKCLIDNRTFRLHYQYTFTILCIASLLATSKQYFGESIECYIEYGISVSVFKTYFYSPIISYRKT